MGRYRLGIDIGGTFTDFTVFDRETGRLIGLKVASTPGRFADAVRTGLERLAADHGVVLRELEAVVHGTTIAVNTVIQRTGARLGVLLTEGFRDLLDLQRLRLPNPLDFNSGRPVPLVARRYVAEIPERVLADGRVAVPLDEAAVAAAARRLRDSGVEGLVVAFLHSYRHPAHEQRAKAVIGETVPGLPVGASSDVWPQAREYERAALAVIDAYVQPKVRRYLEDFCDVLSSHGIDVTPFVTKSNGGIMPVAAARQFTAPTLLSGPASGVIGAAYVAHHAGLDNLITLDVGGTSADIAIVEGGRPRYSTTEHIGDFPVIMPVVGVSSIGAGGGSVAWVDEFGVPKVGPQSMGSNPGPACYGLGGTDATLTDAFLVCGFLDPDHFLGGRMRLDAGRAREAVGRLATTTGTTGESMAENLVRVAVSTMYAEFSKVLSKAAVDPREFALVAFGGAGPLVGCLVARELGIPLVFVPRSPGTLCALGAISADVLNDAVRTVHAAVTAADMGALGREYAALETHLRRWVAEHRIVAGQTSFRWSADMRYVGQSYEIEVEVDRRWLDAGRREALVAAFHAAHERTYGHADRRAEAEIVDIRVQVRGAMPKVTLPEVTRGAGSPCAEGRRTIRLDGAAVTADVYRREALGQGDAIRGAAVVEQDDTTVLVPPGFVSETDRWGNLLIRRPA